MPPAAVKEALVDGLIEFLEAAVHTLIKSRSVYAPHLFESRRLYGISVSQCRHPDVCLYVGSVLSGLRPLLAQDALQELVVAFHDAQGRLLSKVSFIIQGFDCNAQDADWPALEPAFRSALLKLHFSDNLLTPLPEGSTFELLAVATSRGAVNPQVFAEEQDLSEVLLPAPVAGVPVNACCLPGVLSMQVVLEEGRPTAAGAAEQQQAPARAQARASATSPAGERSGSGAWGQQEQRRQPPPL